MAANCLGLRRSPQDEERPGSSEIDPRPHSMTKHNGAPSTHANIPQPHPRQVTGLQLAALDIHFPGVIRTANRNCRDVLEYSPNSDLQGMSAKLRVVG